MRHRARARPVRIVLMPRDDSAMMRRLTEKLVVPEADSATEKLRRGHSESGIPQYVMEAGRDAPSSERVKENFRRVCGFVRVIFVEEFMRRMTGIRERP